MWDKKKIEEALHGFNLTHLALIAVCAFGIFGLTMLKNGFQLNPNVSKAKVQNQSTALTYEEAKAQVLEKHSNQANSSGYEENPLATLDPGSDEGYVLGANTEDGIPQIEASLSKDKLSRVQVISIDVSGKIAMERYFDDVEFAEQSGESFAALSSLSSTDASELRNGSEKAMKVVSYLKGVRVPTEAVEFHRLKIIYYAMLSQLAQSLIDQNVNGNAEAQSSVFFTLVGKIESLEVALKDKYKIES